MAVGVVEIDAAAAVVVADLARAFPVRIGPVLKASITHSAEDLIELFFADEEGVMLGGNLAVVIVKIDGDTIVERDDEHRSERCGARQSEEFCKERRRLPLVAAPNDRVI